MLDELEERIMDVMCDRRYAYPGEVAQDARITREQAEQILERLADLRYVRRFRGRHGVRYQITGHGKQAARTPNPAVWTA